MFNIINENRLEMSNSTSNIGMEVHCRPLSDTQTKEIWLDALAEELTKESGVQLRGDRWQSESGGIDWAVDGYTITEEGQTSYIDVYGGEFDGYVFLVLIAAETEDGLFDGMLLDVTNTIRPVE